MFGIFQQVQGWLKLRGADGTIIGNDGDSINSKVTASVLPTGASSAALQAAGNGTLNTIQTNQATALKQDAQNVLIGPVNETEPADELTASGLNGRLKRIAKLLVNLTNNTTAPLAASLVTYKNFNDIDLNDDTVETVLHSVTGSGYLYGASIAVDKNTIRVLIKIDGSAIFDFTGEELHGVVNKDSDFTAATLFSVSNDGKRMFLSPNTPFHYATSLEFTTYCKDKITDQLYTYSVDA
jgi:hypothetical protein